MSAQPRPQKQGQGNIIYKHFNLLPEGERVSAPVCCTSPLLSAAELKCLEMSGLSPLPRLEPAQVMSQCSRGHPSPSPASLASPGLLTLSLGSSRRSWAPHFVPGLAPTRCQSVCDLCCISLYLSHLSLGLTCCPQSRILWHPHGQGGQEALGRGKWLKVIRMKWFLANF